MRLVLLLIVMSVALLGLARPAPGRPGQDVGASSRQPARPPNIILILADDLGYGELGCYGQQKIRTPNLDRLAAEGARFTRYYAGSPVCAPSRSTLLTGLHTGHTFIRDNRELATEGQLALPADTPTLPKLLRNAGYATGMVGKWGLGGPDSSGEPARQGFQHWFGFLCQREAHNYYPTHLWRNGARIDLEGNTAGNLAGKQYVQDLFTDEVKSFLDSHRDEPFFLYLPFTIPHLSIQTTDQDAAPYRGLWDDPPYDGKKGYLPYPAPRAGYAGMISRLDRDIGLIVGWIRDLGLDERTIILFASDNGPTYDRIGGSDSEFFNSAAGLRGLKGSVFEGGIRVPLIVRWPGRIPAGLVSGHAAAAYDLAPTLLDLAGAPAPAGLDGVSFAPTLLGQRSQPAHEFLYWEFPSYGGQQALQMGRYKAVRRGLLKAEAAIELFDLETDERETTDIAGQQPETVERMRANMKREHAPSREFPFPALDRP
jgi:arylsulfatase